MGIVIAENLSSSTGKRAWVIQRCINAFKNDYEGWPGYCERLLTRTDRILYSANELCVDR